MMHSGIALEFERKKVSYEAAYLFCLLFGAGYVSGECLWFIKMLSTLAAMFWNSAYVNSCIFTSNIIIFTDFRSSSKCHWQVFADAVNPSSLMLYSQGIFGLYEGGFPLSPGHPVPQLHCRNLLLSALPCWLITDTCTSSSLLFLQAILTQRVRHSQAAPYSTSLSQDWKSHFLHLSLLNSHTDGHRQKHGTSGQKISLRFQGKSSHRLRFKTNEFTYALF